MGGSEWDAVEGASPTGEGPRASPATMFPVGMLLLEARGEGVVFLLQVIHEGSEQTGIGTTSPRGFITSVFFGMGDPNPFSLLESIKHSATFMLFP